MNEKNFCPRCGNPLPPYASHGICPVCVARANLGTGVTGWQSGSSGRPPPMLIEEVARLFPEMEILDLLGAGGMGAVYKARQPKLDRLVALKILHHNDRDPSFVERFTREAQTLAKLNHPNIVAVHEFGERDGLFFLIMEMVDGVTLRHLLREGKMKPEQALAIVPPICEALQYAHEKGVVHRDIKPENILLDKEGRVKVADFGIARLAGLGAAEGLTGEGQVVGTAHYMAPEQVERPASVDHRADIYALGVVFYEMLTGELPLGRFPNPSKKVRIDVRLDEVVLKALEKEPEQRYQRASEVGTRVTSIAGSAKRVVGAVSASGSDLIRKRVQVPAIGLMVAGSVNLLVALAMLIHALGTAGGTIASFPFAVWGFGVFAIVFGAFQLLHLQSYAWAVTGAIVALFLPPGFLIGLPFGIWALVLLFQKDVREAFPGGSRRTNGADSRPRTGGDSRVAKKVLWISAAVVAVVFVGFIFFLLAGVVAAIGLPAMQRARDREEVRAQSENAAEIVFSPESVRALHSFSVSPAGWDLDEDRFVNVMDADLRNGVRLSKLGVDLMVHGNDVGRWAVVTSAQLASLSDEAWSGDDGNAMDAALRSRDLHLQMEDSSRILGWESYSLHDETLPVTLAFETSQGGRGLLHITDYIIGQNPGVLVRYKRVGTGSDSFPRAPVQPSPPQPPSPPQVGSK